MLFMAVFMAEIPFPAPNPLMMARIWTNAISQYGWSASSSHAILKRIMRASLMTSAQD
jgi:hypothetical protein